MDEQHLKAALAVMELGSITKAANELYASPQRLRSQIDALEAELGLALFVRSNRGVTLTLAGEKFREAAPALLDHMASFSQSLKDAGNAERVLRISIWPNKEIPILDAICADFHENEPSVRIDYVPASAGRFYSDVAEGVADVGFYAADDAGFAQAGLRVSSVGISMSYRVLLASSHPLAACGAAELHWDDLRGVSVAVAGRRPREAAPWCEAFDALSFDRYEIMSYCEKGGAVVCDEYLADTLPTLVSFSLAASEVEIVVGHAPDPSPLVLGFIESARATVARGGR